jgi:hypothetical protein
MAPQRGAVTLLHLSDTQFGRDHRFGNLHVTDGDGQFDTRAALKKGYGVTPEAILAAGDLAECGRKTEFDEVLALLDRLTNFLEVPRGHVAFVPGNRITGRRSGCTLVPFREPKWKFRCILNQIRNR